MRQRRRCSWSRRAAAAIHSASFHSYVDDGRPPTRWPAAPRSAKAIGSAFSRHTPSCAEDLELVPGARRRRRGRTAPRRRDEPSERIGVPAPVPVVEVAGDAHAAGVGRPDRERRTADPAAGGVVGPDVRAEHVPQVLVPALADQVQVDLAQGGQPAVRVVDLVDRAGSVVDPDPVVADRRRRSTAVNTPPWVCSNGISLPSCSSVTFLRVVPQRAHDVRPSPLRVEPENAVRVVGVAADHLLVVVACSGRTARTAPPQASRPPAR